MLNRLLYVDDEQNSIEAFCVSMRKHFHVVTALGPKDGISIIHSTASFAVIIADLKMPVMDGLEFLTYASKVSPNSARIILTGHADLESSLRAINDDVAWRYIVKPIAPIPMIQTIAEGVDLYYKNVSRLEMQRHL